MNEHLSLGRSRSTRAALALIALALAAGGCKDKGKWLLGKHLLIDQGKPGVCHEFKEKTFEVHVGPGCDSATDPLLSGKWQMKGDGKFAVVRGEEEIGHMVVVSERTPDKIAVSGAVTGVLYRIDDKGAAALVSALQDKGVIKVRALPEEMGCQAIGQATSKISKLAKEAQPRMIRARDEGLDFRSAPVAGDPKVEKVVYALNQDQLDWIAFHLTEAAFSGPGPAGRIEQAIGKPEGTASTGSGDKRQVIVMWRSYCPKLRGASNKEIDITLFSTPGKRQAYYYVSEGIISSTWDELRAAASDPSQQASDDEGEEEGDDTKPAAAAKAPAPAPTPAPTPAPAPAPPPVAARPAPAPKAPPAPKPAAKPGPAKKGGGLAVPGSDDEI